MKKYIILSALILQSLDLQAQPGVENYFVVWGPIQHSDKSPCLHLPPNQRFYLPDHLSFVAFLNDDPSRILTEQAPKWGRREDPNIPGNGYVGLELGNFRDPAVKDGDSITFVVTCQATGEQVVKTAIIESLQAGSLQLRFSLQKADLPPIPQKVVVHRTEEGNLIRWGRRAGLRYHVYRRDMADTLTDGRPRYQYQRVAGDLKTPSFLDKAIQKDHRYAYVVIAEDQKGCMGAHSLEAWDTPRPFPGYADIAVLKPDRLVYPDPWLDQVMVQDFTGKILFSFGQSGSEPGQFRKPVAVATHPGGTVAVLDRDNGRVQIFSSDGKFLSLFPIGPGEIPQSITVDEKGRYWVLSTRRLLGYSGSGQLICQVNLEEYVHHPLAVTIREERIAISDPVKKTVCLLRFEKGKVELEREISGPFDQPWSVQWNQKGQLLVSDSRKRSVFLLDASGDVITTFEGELFGGLIDPRSLSADSQGRIVLCDGRRLVFLPEDLKEPAPEVIFPRKGVAEIRWKTLYPVETRIQWGKEVRYERLSPEPQRPPKRRSIHKPQRRTEHKIVLEELEPITHYCYRFNCPIYTVPPTDYTREFDFVTPLWERGKTAYLRLPVAVMLYTYCVQKDKLPPDAPPPSPLPSEEVERIKAELRDAVRFYWINSRMKLFLDVDIFVIPDFWDVEPYSASFAPSYEECKRVLERFGADISRYVGGVRIIAEQKWDPKRKCYVLAGRGGGFTVGINPEKGWPGFSWWRATPSWEGSLNSWLFVHEYHHQIDAMYHESGHPEYPFCHFSPMEFDGPFGEHFDGNAYILRTWPQWKWFTSRWGEVRIARDSDEDGIPDDLPGVPLDEKRFGSDPHKEDTDGDGLSDMEEALASNWVIQGVGETIGGHYHLPDPTNPDTDSDGLKDGEDPYPLYATRPEIPYASPIIDGKLEPGEWPKFYAMDDPRLQATVYACWDEDYLYFATELNRPEEMKIQIDADDDGWFIGQDNYLVRIKPGPKASNPALSVNLFNCAVPGKYPFWDSSKLKATDFRVATSERDSTYWIEVAIPQNPETGLKLIPGEGIGINIGFKYDPKIRRLLSLFEPNTFFKVQLVRK